MKFREWPLVLFTILGQAAAGTAVFLVLPLYLYPQWTFIRGLDRLRLAAPLAIVGLLGTAALFSLLHLGRPARAIRALSGSSSSWLSREILAELIFGAASAGLAVLAWKMPRSSAGMALSVLVVAEAGAFIYTMARIYTIAAVPAWFSPATLLSFASTCLVMGSLIGTILTGSIGQPLGLDQIRFYDGLVGITLIVIGAAFLVALFYAPRFGLLARKEPFPAVPPPRGLTAAQGVRLVLLATAFGWMAFGTGYGPVLAAAFLSEVIGRFVFYSLPAGL
jgi:DMSO reductase anchor subunit